VKKIVMTTCGLMLLFSGCAASTYIGYRMSPDYPSEKNESIVLSGLAAPVKIYRDELGVPHIDAQNEDDLMRAVGFMHGRERFFEMDTMRRYARGRLSELVGEQRVPLGSTVELDASMRGWGFERESRAEAAALDPQARRLMTAYVEGVNTALSRYKPIEYRLLKIEPETWTIADSFAVAYIIAWGVTHNWRQELSRLVIASYVGVERASRIYPHSAWPDEAALPAGGEKRELPLAVVPEVADLFPARPYDPGEEKTSLLQPQPSGDLADGLWPGQGWFSWASNGWVVGGGRSASGKPILANDPHLPHMLPSIVFQQHLRCPDLDVIGATVPGIPLVLMGHNRDVAWGMTAAVADAADLYIEKLDPQNKQRLLGPGGPEPLVEEKIVIRVRDGSEMREITKRIRRTPRGPLINDLYPEALPSWSPLVSVHTGSLAAGKSILGLRLANRAKTVAELRDHMLQMASPVNAVLAADVNGAVALFATGRVPEHTNHRGTFPVPAWIEKYEWTRLLSADQMPVGIGADNDFFANGNSLMRDPEHGVLFQIDSAPAYRLERIRELIVETAKHTPESLGRIQGDSMLLRARKLTPYIVEDLAEVPGKSEIEQAALGLLAAWDYRATVDSAACAIFFVTYRQAIIGAMLDEVGPAGVDYLLKQRYFTNAVDRWYPEADHPVWDDRATPGQEKRADVVRPAFRQAVAWLAGKLGDDPAKWRWGAIHDMRLKHAFGDKAGAFSLEAHEAPGALSAVWKAHFDLGHPTTPYRANYGPVFRMVVDMADVEHARWIIDSGSSGWPLAPHYSDQFERWRNLEYAPMVMNWDEIRENASAVIRLYPGRIK